MLFVLSPWHAPIALTRAWCLWELFAAAEQNLNVVFHVSKLDQADMLEQIIEQEKEAIALLWSINISEAATTDTFDMQLITSLIQESNTTPNNVNTCIIQCLRKWIIELILVYIDEVESSHLENWKQKLSALLFTILSWLQETDAEKAIEVGERLLVLFKEVDGNDCLKLMHTHHALGKSYEIKNDMTKALLHYQEAFDLCKSADEIDAAHLKNYVYDLSNAYFTLGENSLSQLQIDEAGEYFKTGVSITDEHTQDPNVLARGYAGMGAFFCRKGKNQAAIIMINNAVYAYNTREIVPNLDIAEAYNTQAVAYEQDGKIDEAIETFELALEYHQKAADSTGGDIILAKIYNNFASLRNEQGDSCAATELYEKALETYKTVHGLKHKSTIGTLQNLAIAYHKQGKLDEALKLSEEALSAAEEVLSPECETFSIIYSTLASIFDDKGDSDKSLLYYEKDLEISLKIFGQKHPNIAITYHNMGSTCMTKKDFDEAVKYFTRAVDIFEDTLGEDHEQTQIVERSLHLAEIRKIEQRVIGGGTSNSISTNQADSHLHENNNAVDGNQDKVGRRSNLSKPSKRCCIM